MGKFHVGPEYSSTAQQERQKQSQALIQCLTRCFIKMISEFYLGGSDLADARFLCNRPDLVDKSQRIREILPTGLKNRALGRGHELSKSRHVGPVK